MGSVLKKLFTNVLLRYHNKLEFGPMLVPTILVYIWEQGWEQPLQLTPLRGSILVNSGLACKYQTRVEVTNSGKHSSLLRYIKISTVKSFIVQAHGEFTNDGNSGCTCLVRHHAMRLGKSLSLLLVQYNPLFLTIWR